MPAAGTATGRAPRPPIAGATGGDVVAVPISHLPSAVAPAVIAQRPGPLLATKITNIYGYSESADVVVLDAASGPAPLGPRERGRPVAERGGGHRQPLRADRRRRRLPRRPHRRLPLVGLLARSPREFPVSSTQLRRRGRGGAAVHGERRRTPVSRLATDAAPPMRIAGATRVRDLRSHRAQYGDRPPPWPSLRSRRSTPPPTASGVCLLGPPAVCWWPGLSAGCRLQFEETQRSSRLSRPPRPADRQFHSPPGASTTGSVPSARRG